MLRYTEYCEVLYITVLAAAAAAVDAAAAVVVCCCCCCCDSRCICNEMSLVVGCPHPGVFTTTTTIESTSTDTSHNGTARHLQHVCNTVCGLALGHWAVVGLRWHRPGAEPGRKGRMARKEPGGVTGWLRGEGAVGDTPTPDGRRPQQYCYR